MAEATQGRRQGRQGLDRERPPSGVCRKLESLGVRNRDARSSTQDRSHSGSGHASGDIQMTTFKLIVSAAIVALVANAALPTLVDVEQSCDPAPECVQTEVIE